MTKIIIGDKLRDRKNRIFEVVSVAVLLGEEPYEETDLVLLNVQTNERIERSHKQISGWVDKGLLTEINQGHKR